MQLIHHLRKQDSRRLRGAAAFTLLEVVLALGVAMLVLGVAAFSIPSIHAERGLRRSAGTIETTARKALLEATLQQRTVFIWLTRNGIATGPDPDHLVATHQSEGVLRIRRYGEAKFREPREGESWVFSPNGLCEPLEVQVSSPDGLVELAFDPLTACAFRRRMIVHT